MTVEPFGGEVRDGRVYGRGACDVKGSMAAMLAALSRSDSEPARRDGPRSCWPARSTRNAASPVPKLARVGAGSSEPTSNVGDNRQRNFFPRPPDAAIVAEPTEFNVVVAHQGSGAMAMPHDRPSRTHVAARRGHQRHLCDGARSCKRSNAITPNFRPAAPEHPLCGRPSVCVSTIHGGVAINTVPERATIEIDRRLGTGRIARSGLRGAHATTSRSTPMSGSCRVEHDPPFMQSAG